MKYLLEIIYLIWVVVSIEGTLGKTVQGREVYSDNDDNNVNYDNDDDDDYIESPANNDLTYNKNTEMTNETSSVPHYYDSYEDNTESSDSESLVMSRRASTNSTVEGENKFSDVDNNDIEQSNEQIIPRSMNNELSDNKTSVQDLAVTNGSSSNEVDHTGHGHADEVSRRKCLFLLPVLAKAAAVKAKIIKNRLTANFRPKPLSQQTTTEKPTTMRKRITTTTTRQTTTERTTRHYTMKRTKPTNRPLYTLTSRRVTYSTITPKPCKPVFTHTLGSKQEVKPCGTDNNTVSPTTTSLKPSVTIVPSTTLTQFSVTVVPLTTPSLPPVTIIPSTTSSIPSVTSSVPSVTIIPSVTSSKPPVTISPTTTKPGIITPTTTATSSSSSSSSTTTTITTTLKPKPPFIIEFPVTPSTNKPIIHEVCKPSCCKPPRPKPLPPPYSCSMYHQFCTNIFVPQLNIQTIYQNFCYYNKIMNQYCYYYNLYYQRNKIIQSPCTSKFHLQNMQNQGYQKPSVNNNNKGKNPGRQQQKPQRGNSNNINTNTNSNTNINRNKNKNKPSRRNKKKLNNNNTMEMDKQNLNKKINKKKQNLNDLTLNNNNNNNKNNNNNNNPRHTLLLTDKDNNLSELNKSDIQKIITEKVINKLPEDMKNQSWTIELIDKIVAEKLNEIDIDKKNNDDSDDELLKQRDSLLAHINDNCINNDQSSINPPAWYYQPPPWYYQPPPLPLSPSLPFTPALPSYPPFPQFPPYFDCNNGYDNIYYKKFLKNNKNNNYKYDENSKYYINNIDKIKKKNCNCLTPVIEDKPKDYIFADGIGWLKVHHVPKNWNDARKECIREGAHLAVVNSEKEAKLIVNTTYPPDQYVFVGIHRFFGNHNWESIFDTPLDNTGFSQWSSNIPAKKGYCGALDRKDGLLVNIDCLSPFSFVCKIPIDGPWKTTCTE